MDDDDGVIVATSAEVAETTFTAFTSTREPVTARLVVRPVGRLRVAATDEPLRLALAAFLAPRSRRFLAGDGPPVKLRNGRQLQPGTFPGTALVMVALSTILVRVRVIAGGDAGDVGFLGLSLVLLVGLADLTWCRLMGRQQQARRIVVATIAYDKPNSHCTRQHWRQPPPTTSGPSSPTPTAGPSVRADIHRGGPHRAPRNATPTPANSPAGRRA